MEYKRAKPNEKTIKLLRDEIQSLRFELKQKNSPSLPQNIPNKIQQVDNGTLGEEIEEITEPTPKIETKLVPSSPIETEPSIQQNQIHKITPQRSEEVQAYLDFIENTGSAFIMFVKKEWVRLQKLIL